MPPSRDEDLDWLYGRAPRADEPEPTRVFTPPAAAPGAPPPDAPPALRTPPVRPRPAAPPPAGPVVPVPPAAPGEPGPPRRRRRVRTALRLLAVLLVLVVAWLVAVPVHAWQQVSHVADNPAGDRPADQPGRTFLLVGSDSRAGLTKAQRKKLGTGDVGGQRTDTVMLLVIPPSGKPALVSIPRDSYVPVPGHGRNKINTAFAFGGPKLLEQTVEQDTGVRVDGYLEVGFGGFVNVVDSVGGVRMCLPKAIHDRDSHLDLPKGCQQLDGVTALGYVRMRKADPRGDLGRVERQRAVLAAVAAKAASPATVLDPFRYWRITHAGASSVTLGDDTGFFSVLALARAMKTIAAGDGLTLTVPVSDPGAITPVGSSVIWDEAKAKAMFADLARGDTSDLKKYAG